LQVKGNQCLEKDNTIDSKAIAYLDSNKNFIKYEIDSDMDGMMMTMAAAQHMLISCRKI